MNQQKREQIGNIEALTRVELPQHLQELKDDELAVLFHYLDEAYLREREGLDQLFESMSLMMKYVPNIILHSLVPKYVSPCVSARICRKLQLKQMTSLANGLPAEYVAQSAAEMDSELAIKVLSHLKLKPMQKVAEALADIEPLSAAKILPSVVLDHQCALKGIDWNELGEFVAHPMLSGEDREKLEDCIRDFYG